MVPVDTLCRTSVVSSSIVLLLGPFAGLSLAPLSLFSIFGTGLGVWPDCWVSAEFSAPPSLGRGRVVPPPLPQCVDVAFLVIFTPANNLKFRNVSLLK